MVQIKHLATFYSNVSHDIPKHGTFLEFLRLCACGREKLYLADKLPINLLQVRLCRAVNNMAIGIKLAAVAGAVKCFLVGIPLQGALHVGADGAESVWLAPLIHKCSHLHTPRRTLIDNILSKDLNRETFGQLAKMFLIWEGLLPSH